MNIAQVRRQALSLPEATEEPHFHYTSFRVRGKIFATVPPDADHMHVFVDETVRRRALAAEPDFLEELTLGTESRRPARAAHGGQAGGGGRTFAGGVEGQGAQATGRDPGLRARDLVDRLVPADERR